MSSERHLVITRRQNSQIGNWGKEFAEFAGENYAFESCETWLTSPDQFSLAEQNRVSWLVRGFASVIAFGLGIGSALPLGLGGTVVTLAPAPKVIPLLSRNLKIIAASDELAKTLRSTYPYNRVKSCAPGVQESDFEIEKLSFDELRVCIYGKADTLELETNLIRACQKRGVEATFFGEESINQCNIILYLPNSNDFPLALLQQMVRQKTVLLPLKSAESLGLQPQKDCLIIETGEQLIGSVVSSLQLPMTLESVGLASRATVLNQFDFETKFKELLQLVSK